MHIFMNVYQALHANFSALLTRNVTCLHPLTATTPVTVATSHRPATVATLHVDQRTGFLVPLHCVCMHVFMFMYVCMYACMYACMYVMRINGQVSECPCIAYVCMYVCMYI